MICSPTAGASGCRTAGTALPGGVADRRSSMVTTLLRARVRTGGTLRAVSIAAPTYRERLYAPWWLWAICTVIVATFGVAFGFPLGWVAGVAAGVVAEGAVVWVLVTASAVVEVRAAALVAGRATLGYDAMGTVTALDAPAAGLLRGRHADPRAYLLLRPWVPE